MARAAIGDGVELEYAVSGEGEPLLLIMGTGGTMGLWAPVLPALSESHRVIAYDNRGLGGSTPTTEAVSTASLADDAAALMDALELDRAQVLGWSLGSAVAQELAINHPERVSSLTLNGTWGRPDGFMRSIATAMRTAWAHGTPEERLTATAVCFSPEALDSPEFEALFAEFSSAFPETEEQRQAMVSQIDADLAHDTLDRLDRIGCPTLVLAGEQDVFTAPRLGRAVAGLIPDATFVLLEGPGSSHGMHFERTEEWLGHVVGHLDRRRDAG
jgi:pimeloyl-ACP methyl ester carboxylesterase